MQAVAYHAKAVFPSNTMEKKDYSGGPVPDFHEIPCLEIQGKTMPSRQVNPGSPMLKSTRTIQAETLSTIF